MFLSSGLSRRAAPLALASSLLLTAAAGRDARSICSDRSSHVELLSLSGQREAVQPLPRGCLGLGVVLRALTARKGSEAD